MARSDGRLVRVLLLSSATFLAATIALAGYLWLRYQEIEDLRARLLAENALQERLLRDHPTDRATYPHLDRRVGFVLNPTMERATWYAAEGDSYRINSLGLRGEEIGEKPEGVRRIVLVGDSVLFGWRLTADETLAAALQRLLDARAPGEFQVVTVALPAWNLESENAFLRAHLHVLSPDAVVWALVGNDVVDVPGMVPPAIPHQAHSPQREGVVAFAPGDSYGLGFGLPMPALVARWRLGLERIEELSRASEAGAVPVSLLLLAGRVPLFDRLLGEMGWDPPVVAMPRRLTGDSRWRLSADDPHPTAWANERIALCVAHRLTALGLVPEISRDAGQEEVVAACEEAANARWSEAETEELARELLEAIPMRVDPGEPATMRGVFLGVTSQGWMRQRGLVFLRAVRDAASLRMEMRVPDDTIRDPGRLTLRVETRSGASSEAAFDLAPGTFVARVPLPPLGPADAELQVTWTFEHLRCGGPASCANARLVRAESARD